MKNLLSVALACVILVIFVSCASEGQGAVEYLTTDFIAMDTFFTLKMGVVGDEIDSSALFSECRQLVKDTELLISAHKKDSELYALNDSIDVFMDADKALTELITLSESLSAITGGAFDPSIGALTELWNVKGGGPVPSDEQIAAAMALCGLDKISVENGTISKSEPGTKLDFGAIGKGYVAQRLTEHLFSKGISYGIVSAGRTVGVFGQKPDGSSYRVGIADPFNDGGVVGYLNIDGGFVAVAGDYENYFVQDGVKYHHILDPKTGRPSDSGLCSVAVMAQNGATADALSTALMVMGYDAAMELYRSESISFEAVFITSEGDVLLTDGLSGSVYEPSDETRPPLSDVITLAPSDSTPVSDTDTDANTDTVSDTDDDTDTTADTSAE